MIKNQVLSQCETSMFDHSNDEYVKWVGEIRDRRDIKDLGYTDINIFYLYKIEFKPV